jgi:hypothetical protein
VWAGQCVRLSGGSQRSPEPTAGAEHRACGAGCRYTEFGSDTNDTVREGDFCNRGTSILYDLMIDLCMWN